MSLLFALFVFHAHASGILPKDTPLAHYVAIQFQTADHLTLEGHLALPKAEKVPYPAVLMLVGSGAGNRYEDVPAEITADGKAGLLFQPIEAELLKRGIAVLTYDKRGVHPTDDTFLKDQNDWAVFATADANNLSDDALRAFDTLRARPEVDVTRLGVLGHSEGTILALKVAENRGDQVKSLFMLGMLSQSFLDLMTYQNVTNQVRVFSVLDDNHDGLLSEQEYNLAAAADPQLAKDLGPFDALLGMDKTHDHQISEQEWRYFFLTQTRQMIGVMNDPTQPWDLKTPRAWFTEYFAEGAFLDRQVKLCGKIHLFQGEIDIQTPFEDALQFVDACQTANTPAALFKSYPGEGHGFSPRIGYKKVRDTIGPMDPQVAEDIGTAAAGSL